MCETAGGPDGVEGPAAARAIRAVLDGHRREVTVSYPCHSPRQKRWFMMRVTPYHGPGPGRVVVSHDNITAPKAAQLRASRYARQLEAANSELARLSRRLAAALEMMARNELQETVMLEIVALVESQQPGAACALVKLAGGRRSIYLSAAFPKELTARAGLSACEALGADPVTGAIAALARGVEMAPRQQALEVETNPRTAGQVSGALVAFMPDGGVIDCGVLSRVSSLAAVALEHAALNERLFFQARHDTLAELPNRLLFQEHLQGAIAGVRREQRQLAIAMIDLDRFKPINALHGHWVGDALLRSVAHRLGALLRVGEILARMGGDEFVAILHAEDGPGAGRTAARLVSSLQRPRCLKPSVLGGMAGASTGPTWERRHTNARRSLSTCAMRCAIRSWNCIISRR